MQPRIVLFVPLLTILAFGCATFDDDDEMRSPLLQSDLRPSAGARDWPYERTWSVDLEGDGDRERVVLLAQVERRGDQFLWQDGQPWVVYVEEPSGTRTYVFARSITNGRLDVYTTPAQGNRDPRIILLERSGTRLAAWEVNYRGRDNVRVETLLERDLDAATFAGGSRD